MVPFAPVSDEFQAIDIVFCNLECCLTAARWACCQHQVFFADPRVSDEAVPSVVAIETAGLANNVNYSEAAIMASIARLDEVGVAHTDAGANWAFARAPAILRGRGALRLCAAQLGLLAENFIGW